MEDGRVHDWQAHQNQTSTGHGSAPKWLLGCLYGFLHAVLGKEINSLTELLSKENVGAYAEWCLNERCARTTTLTVWLGMISALGKYPLLGGKSFDWARDLIAGLPPDVENRTQQLKAQKWVDYDVLSQVPLRILDKSKRADDPRKKAKLTRSALLVQWLLVLPWRQRNLRECRIGPSAAGDNLFFEEISPVATVARPKWVEEALQADPHQKFWQFRFGPSETKNGHRVHAILPIQVIGLLEEYLNVHRPALINGPDPAPFF